MKPVHFHYRHDGSPRGLVRSSPTQLSDIRDSLLDQHARELTRVNIRHALRQQPDEARDPEPTQPPTTPDADSVSEFEDPNTEE